MGRVLNFFGCNILRRNQLVKDDLWIRNGKVIDPESVGYKADVYINCSGTVIAPGFLDLKLNGAFGVDFQDPSELDQGISVVRAQLPRTGVTYFCPTIISATPEDYKQSLPKLVPCVPDPDNGAGIIGVHLDGPFISLKGGHSEANVRNSLKGGINDVHRIYGEDLENVAIVTMAPEIEGADKAIPELVREGIIVSLGHTVCQLEQAEQAVAKGASMITHLFNAMPNFHHRDPGLVGLVATEPPLPDGRPVYFGLIADGHHVHRAALRMARRMAQDDQLMIVSDGQAPLGLQLGKYDVGGRDVEVTIDGDLQTPVCKLQGTSTLFGSVCPLNQAVRIYMQLTEVDLAEALKTVSERPAKAMGLYPHKGCLNHGSDADFVILNPVTLDVRATFINGKQFWDDGTLDDLQCLPRSPMAHSHHVS